DRSVRGSCKRDIALRDAADRRMQHAGSNLLVAKTLQRADDGFDRPLDVALDHKREFLLPGLLQTVHHLLERAAASDRADRRLFALLTLAVVDDLAGTGFVLDHGDHVTSIRRALEAKHFDRL